MTNLIRQIHVANQNIEDFEINYNTSVTHEFNISFKITNKELIDDDDLPEETYHDLLTIIRSLKSDLPHIWELKSTTLRYYSNNELHFIFSFYLSKDESTKLDRVGEDYYVENITKDLWLEDLQNYLINYI